VIPGKESLGLMEEIEKKDSIKVVIISVAPNVAPFTKISDSTVTVGEVKLLAVGSLKSEAQIDKKSLKTLVDYLQEGGA
jgi:hypothetical protein